MLFDLSLAVILVVGITFFFLLSWRATVIVGLAIPTSIMATFFIFGVADFTVDITVMLALTVAVGLLVDDAIVVVEAVERDIEAGLSPLEQPLLPPGEWRLRFWQALLLRWRCSSRSR